MGNDITEKQSKPIRWFDVLTSNLTTMESNYGIGYYSDGKLIMFKSFSTTFFSIDYRIWQTLKNDVHNYSDVVYIIQKVVEKNLNIKIIHIYSQDFYYIGSWKLGLPLTLSIFDIFKTHIYYNFKNFF